MYSSISQQPHSAAASTSTGEPATNETQTQPTAANLTAPLTRVEIENSLTEWVSQAGESENRLEARNRILRCFDAMGIDETSSDAKSLLLENLDLKTLPACIGELTSLTELNCQGNRLEALPNAIVKLHRLELLDIYNNQLTSIPEDIGSLVRLTTLYCSSNRITSLPNSICDFPALTTLDCATNCLTHLPENIGRLTTLKALHINSNQIASLPEHIGNLSALQHLECDHNRLTTLPESIGGLTLLRQLICESNLISTLPNTLARLPHNCAISLSNNDTLPWVVIEQLNAAIAQAHASDANLGPRITHSMPALEVHEPRSLIKEIEHWYQASANVWHDNDTSDWQAAIAKAGLDEQSTQAFSDLLARLRVTAHYRVAPKDLHQRVHNMLCQLILSPETLASCAAYAVEGTETCNDRIALAFFLIEEALIERKALDLIDSPESHIALRKIALGLYKSSVLRDIAEKKVKSIVGFIDPTEIILKYWVSLSVSLKLPCQLQDMIFHRCAESVTQDDLSSAYQQVIDAENDTSQLKDYLAHWTPWERMLEHSFPKEYAQAISEISQFKDERSSELENLCSELSELAAGEGELSSAYLAKQTQINEVPKRIRQHETEVFTKLSNLLDNSTKKRKSPSPLQGSPSKASRS